MDEGRPEKESDKERRHGNLVLLAFFVIIVGIGLWLVNALFETRRIDDCIAQRASNCSTIDVPPRQ
jgi:hypothetical protein